MIVNHYVNSNGGGDEDDNDDHLLWMPVSLRQMIIVSTFQIEMKQTNKQT